MADANNNFVQLLQSLLSGDQNVRKPAEATLQENLDSNFASTVVALVKVISQCNREDLQTLAAVCVRRAFKSNTKAFFSFSSDVQQVLKNELMQLCSSTNSPLAVRKKVCDIVEILAMQLLPENAWSDLMSFILKLLSQNSDEAVVIGLYLLGLVASAASLQENDIQQLLQLLGSKLESGNTVVQVEAVIALSRVSGLTENVSVLIPSATNILRLVASNMSNPTTVLEHITEIARLHPEMFQQSLDMIQELVGTLVQSPDEDVKCLALEFVVVFVEADPSAVRKQSAFVETCFDSCLKIMCGLEHDSEEWNEDEDDGNQQDFDMACEAINRLSEALGARASFVICRNRIDQLISQNGWNFKHAGLNAMIQVMATMKAKKVKAAQIWKKISTFMEDKHPRVRYAAISCLAIMCTDFGAKFVTRYSEKIVNCFYSGMQDSNNPRIQSLSVKSLVNFTEKASSKTFLKHLNQIVELLIGLCSNTSVKYVQEGVCSAMAEVADRAGEKYRPYYGKFSGSLIEVLRSENSGEFLQMEALRCLTYIGRAVGPDLFAKEAALAMEASKAYAALDYDTKDLLSCWGRIAETLGEQFQPYLEPVVSSAAMFAVQQIEQTNIDEISEGPEYKYVEYNNTVVAVDINKLEQKECGLELLGKLAQSCPKHFSQVLQECVKNTMPLISYPFSASIRSTALESMNGFCQCAIVNVQQHPEETKGFFKQMLETFCKRLGEEETMSVKALIAYNIYQAISKNKDFAKAALDVATVKVVVQSLIECVKQMNERVNDRELKMMAPCLEEEDVAEIAKENDEERELSHDATDALKALLEIYGEDLLPMILMNDFEWMLSDDAHPIQRTTVLQIFCYIFENCATSNQTREIMNHMIKKNNNQQSILIKCMDEENCAVQQAAIYAVGCVAEQLKGTFTTELAQEILQRCFKHFDQEVETEKSEFDSVLDNDASTIGKILRYQTKAVQNIDQLYSLWLQKCFPIREDPQEAIWCYGFFCELIQNNNTAFLGNNMSNLGLVMNAMVDAYGTSLMDENSEKFFRNLVENLQSTNRQLFVQSFAKMKEEHQRKLQQLIGTQI